MKLPPIEIYLDGPDYAQIDSAPSYVTGFTSNPSLFRKAGVVDYLGACCSMAEVAGLNRPVSLEVLADDFLEIRRQAHLLNALGPNVLVKIPITSTDGTSTAPLIDDLTASGVKVNVTAVTTARQVEAALNIGHRPYVISIFAGRIADSGVDPCDLMRGAVGVCRLAKVRVLWASTREPLDIWRAYRCGVDIITVPPAILAKALEKAGADMTAESLGIVQMFSRDAKEAGYVL